MFHVDSYILGDDHAQYTIYYYTRKHIVIQLPPLVILQVGVINMSLVLG